MKKYTINVTQDDIDKGKRGNPTTCPVARAVKRTLKADTVIVSNMGITLYWNMVKIWFFRKPEKFQLRGTPSEVKAFIKDYDMGLNGKPFSFELEV